MTNYLNYIKWIFIVIFIGGGIYIYGRYQLHKNNDLRLTENARQQEMFDSLRISSTVLDEKRFNEAIRQNKNYEAIIKENGIKLSRVTSIMNHLLKYRDTTIVQTDLSEVVAAVKEKKDISIPIKDSAKCLVIKGVIKLSGGVMTLSITDRIFTGNTTAIGYWERREWNFLGIKTRFLGKKQGTVKLIDDCGESKIINIEKNK